MVEWILGKNTSEKIMTGSYNEILSTTFAKSVRDEIITEKTQGRIVYNDIFPNTKIKFGEASSNKWALEGSGQANYLATSPKGTATGFGCFPKGTKIHTNKGIIDIEKLYKYNKNDIRVLSFDHKNDIIRYNKIVSKRRIISDGIIKIKTNTGRIINSTPDHRYYVRGKGYVEASQLQYGDRLTVANRINMRKMWKGILQKKIRIFKSKTKRLCSQLLLKKMFLQHKLRETKNKKVRNMWRRSRNTSKILFKGMQTNRNDTKQKIVFNNMPNMSKGISTKISSNKILFNKLQEQSSLNKNEKRGKLKLQKWRMLSDRVRENKRRCKKERQLSMSNVWRKRETSREQEIWDNIEFVNTSYRRKQTKQSNGQSDNIMQVMPYCVAQDEKITNIEYVNKRTPVYDIQVENDENFYANGVLVHNCTIMIIDDLIKNVEEAYNENILQKQIDWFNNTMLSRTETGFKLIIIMTRWAENDLAGYVLENYDNVRHINYKAVQEDETMLCSEILNKEDYLLKTKNMNKDIIYANYQQEPIDIKNRLYSNFKTYEKLPPAHYILNYTDTADEGSDFLCSIDYLMYNNEYYILDVIYTQEAMEITEPAVAKMLTKDHVGCAIIESNNGGRGFARNVQRELRLLNNFHTKINWFHQSENKQARILSNSTAVMNNIYFPLNWEDRFPEFAKHLKHYVRTGKNEHDDAEDCLTGVYENPKPKNIMETSRKPLIKIN